MRVSFATQLSVVMSPPFPCHVVALVSSCRTDFFAFSVGGRNRLAFVQVATRADWPGVSHGGRSSSECVHLRCAAPEALVYSVDNCRTAFVILAVFLMSIVHSGEYHPARFKCQLFSS